MSSSSSSSTPEEGAASISAEDACAFDFPDSQAKNYHKTEFILHARVAEIVGDMIGRVFYDDHDQTSPWSLSPENLRDMVLTNIIEVEGDDGDASTSSLYSQYPIYGSAIAFEPGVWDVTAGLDEGVTYPEASAACRNIDETYCTATNAGNSTSLTLTTLQQNADGMSIYSPYAFRGPPEETAYANCSRAQPDFCPSMDLSRAYDYSDVNDAQAEWYTAPRCLHLRDGIRSGYWTSPYFDAGAGGINMVTYSQPIISQGGKFLGIATIDVEVEALCYGDQCGTAVDYNYLTTIRIAGFVFVALLTTASIYCAVWTALNRADRVVRASQPPFLIMICVGCLLMGSSIIPLSIDDSIASPRGCSAACMAFPWLLSIGFTTTFSALFSKIWRLNKLYRHAANFRRVKVTERDVILPFAILMTLNCILLLTWTLVDPLRWVRTEPDDSYQSYGSCLSHGTSWKVFLSLIFAVNFCALAMANVQAFQARSISTEYSEASYVMMTMASLLEALVIGLPLLVLVYSDTTARYFVWSVLIFVVNTAVLLLMFVPKMILVRKRARDRASGRLASTAGSVFSGAPSRTSRHNPTSFIIAPPSELQGASNSCTEQIGEQKRFDLVEEGPKSRRNSEA